jgi:4-hydroxyphenylpyruvate dioxygenase
VRTSIATVSLSGTLEEKLRAAAAAGFDGVEVFEDDLVASPLSPEEVRALARELGLGIELYQPLRDLEALPAERFEDGLRRARHTFRLMNRLGAPTLLVCSNCSAEAVDDDALAAEQLRRLAEVAADHGVRIAYEALAWGRHVNDELHAWRIVAAADHPGLGLCLDSFHVFSRGRDPGAIRRIPGEKIFFVQLADALRPSADVREWGRHHRRFPGEGDFDLAAFVVAVLAAGYRGPLSLEVFNDVFRQADPRHVAVHARRSLLALEERLNLRPLPPPAEVRGWAQVEVEVDERTAPAAAAMLASLGFTRAARHRARRVDLWRQGDIQILLRAGRSGRARGAVPRLSALGLRSADPERTARRARALLAPPRAGPEPEAVELVAPDGTSVRLYPADRVQPWPEGFHPLPGPDGPDAGLDHIDHVELGQRPGRFEPTLFFFRSVLGLEMEAGEELTTPEGLIRGRSVSSPAGEARVAFTVPLVGGGGPVGQHVAFACSDIFATARRLRTLGARILPIPDNYYLRLAAGGELEPELLQGMREHGILYDRDPQGGSLFHLYTLPLGRRLCFEVLQRVGGYRGLGAANALIRWTAQRAPATRAGR